MPEEINPMLNTALREAVVGSPGQKKSLDTASVKRRDRSGNPSSQLLIVPPSRRSFDD